jgi:tight adherence protein C
MTTMLLFGAGFGLGLALLTAWLAPPRPALGPQLARVAAPPAIEPTDRRALAPLVALLRSASLPTPSVLRDLAVLDRSPHDHLATKAGLALAGLLLPSCVAATLGLLGVTVDARIPILVAAGCALVGFLAPDHRVRHQAARRRADFRHALSAFLDLVVISLAGGAGVDSALTDAASAGHGWAFTHLHRALDAARLTRITPWTALRQLGENLAIPELAELAASVSLAGTEGAKVRHSFQAKASALRTQQLAEAESQAAAATERMSLPVMALFLGFLGFITYPAMSQVLAGLS